MGVGRRKAAQTGKRLTRQAETRNLQSGAEHGLATGAGKAGTGTRSGWSRDHERLLHGCWGGNREGTDSASMAWSV